METDIGLPNLSQQILLFCGILAPLLYIGIDQLAGRRIKGYSFTVQSMSELSAAGTPTRTLVVWLSLQASLLLVAFGIGVWRGSGSTLPASLVGLLLIVNALTGLAAMLFFPNTYGERPAFGTPGVLLMFTSVLAFILAMVVGAVAYPGWLRILSIWIPVSYILLAVLRFTTASRSSTEGEAPLIGTQERTMAYSFLLWVMALAIYLLQITGQGVELARHAGG